MRPPMSGGNAPRRTSVLAATRDLYAPMQTAKPVAAGSGVELENALKRVVTLQIDVDPECLVLGAIVRRLADEHGRRSEEHTSELQSHLNLVCRLLLEKKKREPTDT